ncbi:MAG TPA: hypothetical protein VFZ34_04590 [Blastocatellia bacterium]|nr:hypothetical protein [Blastocatellia bacterium]
MLVLFLGVFGLGLAALVCLPKRYESSLKILLVPGQGTGTAPPLELLQSEVEILKSYEVLNRALTENPQADSRKLAIETIPASRLIHVSYQDHSPQSAVQFLQTLYAAYSEQRKQFRAPMNTDAMLRERSAAFQQQINEANAALKQLGAQHDLQSLATQQDLVLKQFYELQKQADTCQIERRALTDQINRLQAQWETQPDMVETGSVTKYGQSADKLKEELHALELQLTQLRQKYQPNHRLLRDQEQRIQQVKEMIAREEQNPPRERSFALNDTRRRLSEELMQAQTQLAALEQREQQLSALTKTYQARLAELSGQGFKKSDLERTRALNEEAYVLFQKKAQEAEIQAVFEQTTDVQIRLLEAATVNPRPISSSWEQSLAGLALLGFMTSIGGVIALESRRPRLRHAASLQRRFGLSVLAKLPPARDR